MSHSITPPRLSTHVGNARPLAQQAHTPAYQQIHDTVVLGIRRAAMAPSDREALNIAGAALARISELTKLLDEERAIVDAATCIEDLIVSAPTDAQKASLTSDPRIVRRAPVQNFSHDEQVQWATAAACGSKQEVNYG